MSPKTCDYIFYNNFNNKCPITIISGMYVFILQQDNTQNIKPEGQQGPEALTAARNKKMSRTNISDNSQYDRN